MFDELYPEASDVALTAKLNRAPEPAPAPSFSFWGMLAAAPKGVAAGAAQGTASGADMTKAVRDKVPANVSGPFGRIPIFNAITSVMQVGADVLNPKEGQFSSEAGDILRGVARDYTPDPQTTHAAEGAVFNLFRMGSKALTAGAMGGNIPGAVLAGVEEGFSMADDLKQQGVDVQTRTKVGAVNAAMNAAGFALPAAGKTWMQTSALALVGGPASFMAQNAATREILQSADYTKQAEQYDPFDPVGLALSTVLPLGFGALAMRGAKAKGKVPDAPPPIHPPDDVVDAARVSLVRQHMDAANPVPDNLAGADAHVKAYEQAMEQMASGERVRVDYVLPEHFLAQVSDAASARFADIGKPTGAPPIADFMAERGMAAPDAVELAAPKGNAFVAWLKDAGGVAWSQKVDIVGERGVRGNYAGIFTKKGQNLDTLVESAVQAGYLSRADVESANDVGGTRALSELIRRATTGEKIPTVENAQASKVADGQSRSNLDAVDYMDRELQALGVDTSAARGNPEVLAAYLADHRETLVNQKLADIEAETAAERIQTGEAFNLTPKQIDQQSRIALASELDENAAYDAAMHARDETDYLNRIEEIIKNDPRSRTDAQRGPGTPADRGIPARDGQATAPATGASGFNPAALATEASRLLSDGRSPAEVIGNLEASGTKVTPELQNMLIGASEFGGRINDLVAQVDALKAQRGPNVQPFDLVAQAVDNMRNGVKVQAPGAPNPLEARLAEMTDRNPSALDAEIAVEFDANGKPTARTTLGEYLDQIKREAAQDAGDASLLEVAANCFLSGAT
jgi:hypothetical protein